MAKITTPFCTKFIFNGEEVPHEVFFRRARWYLKKRSIRKKEIALEFKKHGYMSKDGTKTITLVLELSTRVIKEL